MLAHGIAHAVYCDCGAFHGHCTAGTRQGQEGAPGHLWRRGAVALIIVTIGIAKLKPAAPTVDRSTVWSGTVARGNMLRQVRGLGTLVPEDIHGIPAQSNARVDRIVLRSGAILKPDSIILELSDPQLQDDALTAQLTYQEAEADYENLKVQLDSQLMALKEVNAGLLGQYNQDRLQAQTDKQLADQGLKASVLAQQSQMRADQEATQLKLDDEKLSIQAEANKAQLDSQAAKVDSARALYNLKKSQLDALHVRRASTASSRMCPWMSASR